MRSKVWASITKTRVSFDAFTVAARTFPVCVCVCVGVGVWCGVRGVQTRVRMHGFMGVAVGDFAHGTHV
jgi:hypothetical protein